MIRSLLFGVIASLAVAQDEAVLNKTYDYIIVGGGTSGLTVANRLTENGKRKHMLLLIFRDQLKPLIQLSTKFINPNNQQGPFSSSNTARSQQTPASCFPTTQQSRTQIVFTTSPPYLYRDSTTSRIAFLLVPL